MVVFFAFAAALSIITLTAGLLLEDALSDGSR